MKGSKTVTSKEDENKSEKDFQAQETDRVQVAMMCWEILEGFLAEEPKEETSSQDGRADNEMEKPKYEEAQEEHVVHTQLTKNLDQRI